MNAQHDMIFSTPRVNSHDTAVLCEDRFSQARTLYVFSGSANAALEWYRRRDERDRALGAIDHTIALLKAHSWPFVVWLLLMVVAQGGALLINPDSVPEDPSLVVLLGIGIPAVYLAVLLLLYCRADSHRERLEREAHTDRSSSELLTTCSHNSLLSSSGAAVTADLRARIDILVRAELEAEARHELIQALSEHRAAHLSRTIHRPSARRRGR